MTIEDIYQRYLKASGISTDTRSINENCMFFALKGDNFDGNTFAEEALNQGASYCVIDNKEYEVNNKCILVDDVLKTLQTLATYHKRQLSVPIIALTGSNGKTTTKELINRVLSKKYNTSATVGNLNNHIGVPLTLLRMDTSTEMGIVEMGANHQKEIEFLCTITQPDFGLITNFGKAHLEGFGGIEGVIKGKSELYEYLRQNDKIIFVNEHDELQIKQSGKYENKIMFGKNISLLSSQPYLNVTVEDLVIKSNLIGAYNFNNICTAIALGRYFKVEEQDIIDAIESYLPKSNRSQLIKHGQLTIVLDAYNANPTSMEAALKSFTSESDSKKTAILGDMFELGEASKTEHEYIVNLATELDIDKLIFVGKHFYKNKRTLNNVLFFENYEELKTNFKKLNIKTGKVLIKGSRGMALERVLDLL